MFIKKANNNATSILCKKMPLFLRIKVVMGLLAAGDNSKKRMEVMKEANKRRRFTVPREQIPWNPRVDSEKCSGCDVCIEFCPKKVYEKNEATATAEVSNPQNCVFLCTGCITKCKNGAISFPDREEFVKYIYYV